MACCNKESCALFKYCEQAKMASKLLEEQKKRLAEKFNSGRSGVSSNSVAIAQNSVYKSEMN